MDFLRGDGYGGRGVHVTPPKADASLIFMHGRGDSGEGWSSLAELLNDRNCLCGRIRLFLPTAEEIMVTKYKERMNAWFDSRSNRRDVDEDFEGFEKSRKRIEKIIQGEIQQGIKPQRIIVAGFSQGGAMAYFVALRSSAPLGGAICLSGWCPFLHDLQVTDAFANSGAPFLHAHGTADAVVEYEFAREAFGRAVAATQKAASGSATASDRFLFKTYQNLGHTASSAEMNHMLGFLESCLTRSSP